MYFENCNLQYRTVNEVYLLKEMYIYYGFFYILSEFIFEQLSLTIP
jgi:hypothetical protein